MIQTWKTTGLGGQLRMADNGVAQVGSQQSILLFDLPNACASARPWGYGDEQGLDFMEPTVQQRKATPECTSELYMVL